MRGSLLKFKIYEITTCAIDYIRRKLFFWKNNDQTLTTELNALGSRIIGGVGIIGGLYIVIIINNRGGCNNRGGWTGLKK